MVNLLTKVTQFGIGDIVRVYEDGVPISDLLKVYSTDPIGKTVYFFTLETNKNAGTYFVEFPNNAGRTFELVMTKQEYDAQVTQRAEDAETQLAVEKKKAGEALTAKEQELLDARRKSRNTLYIVGGLATAALAAVIFVFSKKKK